MKVTAVVSKAAKIDSSFMDADRSLVITICAEGLCTAKRRSVSTSIL